MRHIISALCVAAGAIAFTSCNEKAKLADSLTGTWSSAPERIATADTRATTTVERTLTFLNDESSNTGGDVDATVKFSILTGTQLQAADVQPISITAEGTASVSGRWEATDDDEIVVNWNFSTLKVNVDPDAVSLDYDVVTQNDSETLMTLKPAVIKALTATISSAMPTEVFNFGKVDDIKFINNSTSLKCEIGDKDYVFNRLL
ncbi:MAG: hypothetical protein K2I64_06520 [Muribaculaceae bacterium]|nr:hypothetical protein [Muribaculaceae bacterium]